MKSFYEVLDVSKTASAQEIKRAYFAMVKKFPPESFPEEFKEIRAAYETLSDEGKRAGYDRRAELPPEAAEALNKAAEFTRIGKHKNASEILREAMQRNPGEIAVKAALARSLEREDKNGTAMKLWEELCSLEPDNAEYARNLALSYDHRGWVNKAAEQYEKALSIDDGDADTWEQYIDFRHMADDEYGARALCKRANTALRAKGQESAMIYAYCVFHLTDSPEDEPAASGYLADMKRVMQSRPAERSDIAAIDRALEGVMGSGSAQLFPLIRELADLLPRKNETLEKRLNKAKELYEIERLEKEGFSGALISIIAALSEGCDCDDCKLSQTAMEFHILDEITASRQQLNRLKREYHDLYKLHSDFFDEVIRTREPEKMMEKRYKEYHRMKSADDPYPTEQTVRREAPKVGRNDLCPCGSGKKYKRCCGANQ